jgi:hypothetical protein
MVFESDYYALLATQSATSTLCGTLPYRNYAYEPVVIIFLIFALVAFFLRTFARFAMDIKLWWDDLCVLIAMVRIIYRLPPND